MIARNDNKVKAGIDMFHFGLSFWFDGTELENL